MKEKLEFEIVDVFVLSTGFNVITCTPDKFDKRLVTGDNISSVIVGNNEPVTINIVGEDIHVRSNPHAKVEYSNFQTRDDISFIKNNLGTQKIILQIIY